MYILSNIRTKENQEEKGKITFFREKMLFYKLVREYSLRQGLSSIYRNMNSCKKLRFRNFL